MPKPRLVIFNRSPAVRSNTALPDFTSKDERPGADIKVASHLRLASSNPLIAPPSWSKAGRPSTVNRFEGRSVRYFINRISDDLSVLSRTNWLVTPPRKTRQWVMVKEKTRSQIETDMCRRLKEARIATGETQKSFAAKLGISEEAYRKNENRSPLPAYLIPSACDLLGMDPWFLLTGQHIQRQYGDAPAYPDNQHPDSPPRRKRAQSH